MANNNFRSEQSYEAEIADLRREVEQAKRDVSLIYDESKHARCVHASSNGPLDCVFCAPWAKRNLELRREAERHRANAESWRKKYNDDVTEPRAEVERLKDSTCVVMVKRLRNQYDEQVKWNDELRAEIAALKAKLDNTEPQQRAN